MDEKTFQAGSVLMKWQRSSWVEMSESKNGEQAAAVIGMSPGAQQGRSG